MFSKKNKPGIGLILKTALKWNYKSIIFFSIAIIFFTVFFLILSLIEMESGGPFFNVLKSVNEKGGITGGLPPSIYALSTIYSVFIFGGVFGFLYAIFNLITIKSIYSEEVKSGKIGIWFSLPFSKKQVINSKILYVILINLIPLLLQLAISLGFYSLAKHSDSQNLSRLLLTWFSFTLFIIFIIIFIFMLYTFIKSYTWINLIVVLLAFLMLITTIVGIFNSMSFHGQSKTNVARYFSPMILVLDVLSLDDKSWETTQINKIINDTNISTIDYFNFLKIKIYMVIINYFLLSGLIAGLWVLNQVKFCKRNFSI